MLVLLVNLAGCVLFASDPWENAQYTEDTELGEGAKTFTLEVKVYENSVAFTVHTDKDILGDALSELELIEGEEGPYGLYLKKVNGITADYNTTKTYWALYINGEYALTGIDGTNIEEGDIYRLEYSK